MAEEKVLDTIAALLARAEHPNTPAPEAELALMQANRLMAKHAIEEALVRQKQSRQERRQFVRKDFEIGGGYSFRSYLKTILAHNMEANRCAGVWTGDGMVAVFGAEEDVRWVEMLHSMIRLQFLQRLEPKWDSRKTYDENVYNFKVAGYSWKEINAESVKHGSRDARKWEIARGRVEDVRDREANEDQTPIWEPIHYGYGPHEFRNVRIDDGQEIVGDRCWGSWEEPSDKLSGILIAAYKRWAANVGDDSPVTTQSHQAYRLSYAEGFRAKMADRFRRMIEDNLAEMDTIPGAALALRDTKEEIKQKLWADFPDLSPEEMERRRQTKMLQDQREAEERQAKLDAMTPKQREAFLEKEERERRRDQKYWEKYWDKSARSVDRGAQQRGASAADSVDLTRKAGYADASNIAGEIS